MIYDIGIIGAGAYERTAERKTGCGKISLSFLFGADAL